MISEGVTESNSAQGFKLPYFHNLGQLFTWIAERSGGRPALIYPDQTVSFADLNQLHLRLAALLEAYGIRHGDRVAIVSSKGVLTYGLMLACLRLGVSYVNLDPAAPLDRNLSILASSRTTRVFVEDLNVWTSFHASVKRPGVSVLQLMDELPTGVTVSADRTTSEGSRIDGSTIAYVMYTSGSTGVPKGVAISHQSVLHFISWIFSHFGITSEDRFSGLNPLHFDNSVFDFYGSIFLGAALVPILSGETDYPENMLQKLERVRCTIWFSVPSLLIYLNTMRALTTQRLENYRYIIFGGEGFPKSELKKLRLLVDSRTKLVNVYGPTECTCICSAYQIQDDDFETLDGLSPLGSINQNIDFLILDEMGAESEVGELCLLGDNVALGYVNDPERTAASFSVMQTSDRFGKRMYRTGDIVDSRNDKLKFVGRKDNQIKHMGYRIELEEIEHALTSHSSVIQAAAIYVRINESFGNIIAFVSTASVGLSEQGLLTFVRGCLPNYMTPSRILIMDDLPKNQNGKVDRLALAKSFRDELSS